MEVRGNVEVGISAALHERIAVEEDLVPAIRSQAVQAIVLQAERIIGSDGRL